MKLDPTILRTMPRSSFRVLTAVETGMKSGHYLVPSPLICSIANLRHGGTQKHLSALLRDKLLSHDRSCGYDGYRLTNAGYDILALENLKRRGLVSALGDAIGIGKESDVYLAAMPSSDSDESRQVVLKFHRLGRTSFRDVKKKRDYFAMNQISKHRKRGAVFRQQPNSWLFLSRISALKEYAFMKALYGAGYPTPEPIGHNRHVVVMGLVRGVPLYQVRSNRVSAEQAESIFRESVSLAGRLAGNGLVHCDLNEFNLMVDMSGIQRRIAGEEDAVGEHYVRHSGMSVSTKGALSAHGPLTGRAYRDGTGEIVKEETPEPKEFLENGEPKPMVTLIDFPQMVSTRHPNAKELFERDSDCLKRFFECKLKCVPDGGWDEIIPRWEDVIVNEEPSKLDDSSCLASKAQLRLDEDLKASGFSDRDSQRDMELYYHPPNQAYQIQHDQNVAESSDDDGVQNTDSEPEHEQNLSDTLNEEESDEESDDSAIQEQHSKAEQKARERVRRHFDDRKKKNGRKNAFRSKNNNKTFVKGKRVMNDDFF